jgi:hypothetical protein
MTSVLPAGTQLGKYQIRMQFGAGGVGEAYLDSKPGSVTSDMVLMTDIKK